MLWPEPFLPARSRELCFSPEIYKFSSSRDEVTSEKPVKKVFATQL